MSDTQARQPRRTTAAHAEAARRNGQKGGRPDAADPKVNLCVRLPTSDLDRIIRLARKHDTTVPSLVRTLLTINFGKHEKR